MENKNISTKLGVAIITIFAITILAFVMVWENNKKSATQHQNNIVLDNSELGNKKELKQEKENVIKNNQVQEKEGEDDNNTTIIIDMSNWKNYSNKIISFFYPSQCYLKTASDSLSNKNPNMYLLDQCFDKNNHFQILSYNNLDKKYVEDMINSQGTVKYKELKLPSGEKIIMLKFKND